MAKRQTFGFAPSRMYEPWTPSSASDVATLSALLLETRFGPTVCFAPGTFVSTLKGVYDSWKGFMSRVRILWAFCLAMTIAIFPIAAPRALAHEGHGISVQAEAAPHFHATDVAHQHDHAGTVAANHNGKKQKGEQSPSCCGTVACHAYLASVTPELRVSRNSIRLVAFYVEEQTSGHSPSSLDRPPRTA